MASDMRDFHHPFRPYKVQEEFMEAMYQCLERRQVGIFESPTGKFLRIVFDLSRKLT